ncbi:ABC transporter ATP-binding protein [Clostridium sp. LIBA-8841]|uniref:ABC transporter ATP-binding protein n=1 Tax=Clostridium sp. LIBA-8841 TaxID=2987530 RepID=UPI002AC551DC|nr:ABC transporter ATP-binding protein [Clostridium sp. LIBA-8841]MDZ5254424.1 ABC transporter ATP-binding protein [Clostridium sp. LIBA-8841]
MENVLEVKNISKNYKEFSLKDVSFNIPKGFVMGLIGPNGAGKTTTIKAIMNLIHLDGGEIDIFGEDIKKNEIEIKDRVGFVYDDCCAFEDFTIKENKNIIAPFYSKWDEEKFKYYISRFELNEKKKLKELSKGQKMRFSLAIALSHKAELLILDEPTSGLDPVFRSELLDILFEIIGEEEVSVLYSTHITTDLERLADYITFINKGKIEFSKEKDLLLEEYFIVKGALDALNKDIEKELIGLRKTRYNFEGLTKNMRKIKSICEDSIIFEKATLDDIVVYYSKKDVK